MPELYRDESGERTEQPTPLRLAEARRRGIVPRSGDLSSAVVVLGALSVVVLLGPRLLGSLTRMTAALLDGGAEAAAGPAAAGAMLWENLTAVLAVLAPLGFAVIVIGVLANVFQVGLVAADEAVRPDFGRLSPAAGLRRIVSRRSVARMALTVAKVLAAGVVCALVVRELWPRIVAAGGAESPRMPALAGELVYRLAVRLGIVLVALGAVDWLYQRWQHGEDLKMTRRELKDDLRRMEGDPLIRSRRKQRGRRGPAGQPAAEVPRASVTIAGRGGLAVALRYDETAPAPRVVALGTGRLGERVRQIATRAGVRVVEDEVLARALHQRCRPGGQIPPQLYGRVAEILAQLRLPRTLDTKRSEDA